MSTGLPFEGLRVVDLGSFWAAPYMTSFLGARGADVVKVESIQRPDGFRFTSTMPELGDRWLAGAFAENADAEQLAGLAWVTGYPDGRPQTPGGYIDPTVGMHAAVALLAAIEHRDRTGEGQLVEVAQIEVGASMAAESVISWSLHGEAPGRSGNRHPVYAPQGVYECAQDRPGWVALSVRHDEDWAALITLEGAPDALRDERFATASGRRSAADELDALLEVWCATQNADDLAELLVGGGVPAARVLTVDRFNEDPHLVARSFYQSVEHPLSGPRLFPRYPMRFDFEEDARVTHQRPAPLLGQHNTEILRDELGLSQAEVAALEEAAVIGNVPRGV